MLQTHTDIPVQALQDDALYPSLETSLCTKISSKFSLHGHYQFTAQEITGNGLMWTNIVHIHCTL